MLNLLLSLLKKLWRIPVTLFWGGLWLFGLGLLLWYALRWWPGDRLLPVRLANYLMPWLLVGLIPALVVAGVARRYRLMMLLAIPTLLIGLTFAPLFLPRPPTVLAASTPLKVMSYNVWARNRDISSAAALIRQEQPDILLLQEVKRSDALALNQALTDLYRGSELHFIYEPAIGQAIASRYPLTPRRASYQNGRTQKVIADTPAGPIAVWNAHPHAPFRWSQQYREISGLVDEIAAMDGPLILGGVFNTTDQAETYRLISQHLQNAHWEAGWGFGFSYPAHTRRFRGRVALPPLVRIDHIFYSHHFFARQASTLPTSGGSDHLPVVTELFWIQD
ncbi:MAG: endonuclease/exonuclease/phosphatase family protein [Anaerolineae bacterium]|nr:endonuclease/exonuclease/phosphatase family protein [Anaerolineae bacterium]